MLRGFVLLFGVLPVLSVWLGDGEGTTTTPRGLDPLPAPGPTAAPPVLAPGPTALRPLPFFYDLYTFRGDAGRTLVVASMAVPARGLGTERSNGEVQYRFDTRFVLTDTLRRTVSRSDDSVFVSRPGPLDRDHLLHTHVEIATRPSSTTLQRVIMTDATRPGVGQLYSSVFAIPDYSGPELMLSDVALGLPGATVGWERGAATIALLPTSQFPESSFDVYYEIYNLPADAPYETEIAVETLGARGQDDSTVRTRFSGESAAGTDGLVSELRRVDTALPEGRYRLTVTVTDSASGRTARRSRDFQVRGWEAGATLVPALPRRTRTEPGR